MSFKLKSLTVENFVVFVDRTDIDFSNSQINNIEGAYKNNSQQSNGAGKSLIMAYVIKNLFDNKLIKQLCLHQLFMSIIILLNLFFVNLLFHHLS
jgi:hypothetical protein